MDLRPNTQGTMALYLSEDGDSNIFLGPLCYHVLVGSKEANVDYVRRPRSPFRDVFLLGKGAFSNLIDSIKISIGRHGIAVKCWRKQIE